jgi:uncharacterized protein (DUF1684 family)
VLALAAAPAPAPATTPTGATPAGPVVLEKADADSLSKAIEKYRDDQRNDLKAGATSYLATTQRIEYLWRSRLRVGTADTCDVGLSGPGVRPYHLTVDVVGDSFRVVARDPAATFKLKGVEMRKATVGPSAIEVGSYTLRLSHQHFPAIIVFDPKSPRFASYHGISYYPVDLKWRYVLPLTSAPSIDTLIIISTRGNQRRAVRMGWFDFMVGDTRCRLEADRLLEPGVGEHDLAVFFKDATSGTDTYPVGRYIDPVALGDGRYVLDFNLAYNPACAYSEHYNCPIPPRKNRLPIAVTAGEKDSHYLEHGPGTNTEKPRGQ